MVYLNKSPFQSIYMIKRPVSLASFKKIFFNGQGFLGKCSGDCYKLL